MLNFNQQEDEGMFPPISGLKRHIHPIVPYVIAVCLAIGGYFYGISQDRLPVALCVAVGLVLGLLLDKLLLHLTSLVVGCMIVGGAGLLTWFLLANDAALRGSRRPPETPATAPAPAAHKPQSALDDLVQAVRP